MSQHEHHLPAPSALALASGHRGQGLPEPGVGSRHRALFCGQMWLEGVWVLLVGAGHSPG